MNSTKPWRNWATTAALGAALVAGSGALGAPAAAASAPQQQREADAVAQARRTGQAVEIVARRTATTEVYANPTGSYTLKLHAQPAGLRSDDPPPVTAVNNYNWTHISQAYPSSSYWTAERNQAKVGYSSSQKAPWRSFFLFDVPAELAGAQIVNGTFSITLDNS
ncbi:hypothetical protein ACFO1B_57490, partial [Dactylosporangium siamense]|uniref:hypothetical protein n=1 Tax=Dactylosporangium siamense TaxID=685454 RepID=UPI00361F76EC